MQSKKCISFESEEFNFQSAFLQEHVCPVQGVSNMLEEYAYRQKSKNVIYWRCTSPLPVSFLISLLSFKNQSLYPQTFLQAQILAKKIQLSSYKKKKKSHFRHHKTCPERGERSSSHCVISQPDIFVSTEVMNNWIISPDLQFCLGFSASVAWYRMIPRSFMNEWCLCQVNSPDLCFTPMVAFTDNHDLQKHEWEGSANLVSFFVLFLCFPPWL